MASTRNSKSLALDNKILAIREGTCEDLLNIAEVILYASKHRKLEGLFSPLTISELSREIMGNPSYLADFTKDIYNGRMHKASDNLAAALANVTAKDINFWKREHYSLAEAQGIQIILPNEISPKPTVAVPARAEQGLTPTAVPTARDLAKAVLFPADLTPTNIAPRMKEAQTERC